MKSILAIAALAAVAGTANAQIASWDSTGLGTVNSNPGTGSANVSALDMAVNGNVSGTAANNAFNTNGWSVDPADHISFGFSVDAGYQVDLTSLTIGTRSSNSGPGELGLFYSGDNYATSLFTFNQDGGFQNDIIDLSALTGLTGTVEFRIIATDDIGANGNPGISTNGTFRVTDFFDAGNFIDTNFAGTTSLVPAPGAAAMLGLAGVAGIRRRRA